MAEATLQTIDIHERYEDGRPARVTLTIDTMIKQVTATLRCVNVILRVPLIV